MKNIQEQQTKEHKSFKEVVKQNRGKIIAGIGIIGCGVCYMIASNKYQVELRKMTTDLADKVSEINHLKRKTCLLEDDVIDLYEDNQTLSAILSEGVLQDAITTTSNKINSRLSKLRILEDRLKIDINDNEKKKLIEKIKGELETLTKRKDLYETKLHIYEIKDLAD